MVQIFPYSGDDDLAMRTNAAVTLVALAAGERIVPLLHHDLGRPYEQLRNAWDLVPLQLRELFSQAYRAWTREKERPVHPNPRLDAAAVTACTYAIAIVSIVGPIGDMELLKLRHEHETVVEELHRRAGR
ncbi:hypothetical protein HY634_03970 [Candidatus Uhrbacteria bacterium]|nr:hypothetical protein [Candidatus Uhrbacteria bacterium]